MAYLHYGMCHNLKPSKINDEDPLFIFKFLKNKKKQFPHVIM
jgi:hypothetical protein